MKNSLISLLFVISAFVTVNASDTKPGWRLIWEDNFDTAIDTTVWSKCDRGNPDWCNTMSNDDRLFDVRDGILVLRGMVNPDTVTDPSPYITGGIWTKGKKAFEPGKFEIKARLHGAKGAWPAIWLLPYETEKYMWPEGGEIDIMERLNNNHVAYQTVHSHYTYDLGQESNPRHGGTYPIDREDWNVYGVEIHPDKVVFSINGNTTLVYPKINDGKDGQFPFYIPQYLLIDMQLGGNWVGAVDPADLPVEMEVDWVRYYTPEK